MPLRACRRSSNALPVCLLYAHPPYHLQVQYMYRIFSLSTLVPVKKSVLSHVLSIMRISTVIRI